MSKSHKKKPESPPVEGAATGIIRYQLGNAKDRIAQLEAQIRGFKAELGKDPDELLVQIAHTLNLAELASDARQAQRYDESGIRQHARVQPIPGTATHNQRVAGRKLRRNLRRAVSEYESSASRNWPNPPDLVRCRNSECRRQDKRLEAWDSEGPNEYCQKCGYRLTA